MLLNFLHWLQKTALFHQKKIVFHNKAGLIFKWHCIIQVTVAMTEMWVSCFFSFYEIQGGNQNEMQMEAFFVFFILSFVWGSKFNRRRVRQNFQQLQPGLTVLSCSFAKSISETKWNRPWTFIIFRSEMNTHAECCAWENRGLRSVLPLQAAWPWAKLPSNPSPFPSLQNKNKSNRLAYLIKACEAQIKYDNVKELCEL